MGNLLVHLEQSVRNWGPLWATSCFVFEDTAGKLLSSFHGTQSVPRQMFKCYLAKRNLVKFHTSFVDAAGHVVETFQKMSETIVSRRKCIHISEGCVAFTDKPAVLTPTETLVIEERLGMLLQNRNGKVRKL